MKKYFFLILSIFFLVSCEIDSSKNYVWNMSNTSSWKISIVSSIVPISSIINYIWWDEVEVKTIVPSWVSPHNFDLKAENMILIEKSDLIVRVWLEHIDWFLDKVIQNKNDLKLRDWIKLIDNAEVEEENEHTNEHDEHNHSIDPHIWLWIENTKIIAWKIKDELTNLKTEKQDIFQKNYNNFIDEIDNSVSEFKSQISWKKPWNFIVFHDAYNYLFSDLEISNDKKFVFKPNILSDLNSKEMKDLQDNVKQLWIKNIFKEPQFNDPNLEKFANEFSLQISIIDPLGKSWEKTWYIDNLKENLENLKIIYE